MNSESQPEFPSTVFATGPSWAGFEALKYLIIFGDSYSAVGYDHLRDPAPTREEPLGIKFPGETYAEWREPCWVGHLICNHSPNPNLLIYDYAEGGANVFDVKEQVQSIFLGHIGHKPESAPWTPSDALFITWVGINDAALSNDHVDNVDDLFKVQEKLHETGARNFLFVNIPPIHRSPAIGHEPNYINWNVELKRAAASFSAAHPDSTVMLFSSWDTFTTILNSPSIHGFPTEDAGRKRASIWVDFLHPTTKMHDFIARDIAAFLCAQPAHNPS
ncbi:hypothetical protein C8J57DRAFT_64542 [Mycena rebaudengoi]|nr:hypothetical protein C8J57DRAFT_64542 [Mycena rebaudengoi]